MGINDMADMFNTKFTINGTEWNVFDWTIFVIVIAVLIVLSLVLFLFFCCIGKNQEECDAELQDQVDKDREEIRSNLSQKPDENNFVAALGEAEKGAGVPEEKKEE